jgi:hypothetical protein
MNIEEVHCRRFYFLEGEDWLVSWLATCLLSQFVMKLLILPQRDKILFHSTDEAVNICWEAIAIYFENDMILKLHHVVHTATTGF